LYHGWCSTKMPPKGGTTNGRDETMLGIPVPRFQLGIRFLLALTCAVALFVSGFCLGVRHQREAHFNYLADLIKATIDPSRTSLLVRSTTTSSDGMSVLTAEGCEYYPADALPIPRSQDGSSSDPFLTERISNIEQGVMNGERNSAMEL